MSEPKTRLPSSPLDHDLALKIAALVKEAADPPLAATGEPGKFTPDVLTRLVAAIRLGHTVNDACTFAGLGTKTYRTWLRRGESGEMPYAVLVEVIERLNIQAITPAVACFKKGAEEDPKVAERFLARRAPKEWGTQQEQSGGGVTVMFGLELKGAPE